MSYKLFIILMSIFTSVNISIAQKIENPINCIQGAWRGLSMDIEPYTDLSNFYQIIKSDSIISFYIDEDNVFESNYKFLSIDIQETDTDFYEVDSSHILSSDQKNFQKYHYSEIDADSNIAIDEYFICGKNSMTKLHFEYEKLEFIPYSVYNFLKVFDKETNTHYVEKFSIIENLKRAKIISSKSYFHNDQDTSTIRKGFVVNGDSVIIDRINKDWLKVAYEGKTATTEGWLKRSDVEILP